MKHYTHIYLAHKAIEMLADSAKSIRYKNGRIVADKKRRRIQNLAVDLQRILMSHIDRISEASWAPDDIINDKSTFHVFKLFKADEFTDYQNFIKSEHTVKGQSYYRTKKGGGLPYKVEHLARTMADMLKLRKFNDIFTMEQVAYQLFLLSHYVVDAHVPMHCDIRDDKPSTRKPANGVYYGTGWHGKIEKWWEDACTPVALDEELIKKERGNINEKHTTLSSSIKFDVKKDIGEIEVRHVEPSGLIDYMIEVCAESKERNRSLFPVGTSQCDRVYLDNATRDIFRFAISRVISVWLSIWVAGNPKNK